MSPLQADAQAGLAALNAWVEAIDNRRPERSSPVQILWHRDGLRSLHDRLESLKVLDSLLTTLLSEAFVRYAHAKSWAGIAEDQIAEALGPDIERHAATLSNKGLAAEERWLSHRLRTFDWWQIQRGFEKYAGLIDAIIRSLQADGYCVRDERLDLRAQLQGIRIGFEIGEL